MKEFKARDPSQIWIVTQADIEAAARAAEVRRQMAASSQDAAPVRPPRLVPWILVGLLMVAVVSGLLAYMVTDYLLRHPNDFRAVVKLLLPGGGAVRWLH